MAKMGHCMDTCDSREMSAAAKCVSHHMVFKCFQWGLSLNNGTFLTRLAVRTNRTHCQFAV
jgi:hypothetical protein